MLFYFYFAKGTKSLHSSPPMLIITIEIHPSAFLDSPASRSALRNLSVWELSVVCEVFRMMDLVISPRFDSVRLWEGFSNGQMRRRAGPRDVWPLYISACLHTLSQVLWHVTVVLYLKGPLGVSACVCADWTEAMSLIGFEYMLKCIFVWQIHSTFWVYSFTVFEFLLVKKSSSCAS